MSWQDSRKHLPHQRNVEMDLGKIIYKDVGKGQGS